MNSLVPLVNEKFPNWIVKKTPEQLQRAKPVHLSLNTFHVNESYMFPSLIPWHRTLRYFTHKGERTLKEAPGLEEARFAVSIGYAKDRYQFKLPQPISTNEAQEAARANAPRRNLSGNTPLSVRFFDRPYVALCTKHTNAPSARVNDMVERLDIPKAFESADHAILLSRVRDGVQPLATWKWLRAM